MKLYNYLANKASFRGSSHISYDVKAYFLCGEKASVEVTACLTL